jgi:hypothetical protein
MHKHFWATLITTLYSYIHAQDKCIGVIHEMKYNFGYIGDLGLTPAGAIGFGRRCLILSLIAVLISSKTSSKRGASKSKLNTLIWFPPSHACVPSPEAVAAGDRQARLHKREGSGGVLPAYFSLSYFVSIIWSYKITTPCISRFL